MIYRSNLTAPDLQPAFRHTVCRVMGHSLGHDVISDWADKPDDDPVFGIYKRCGFWTHDEAAILHNVAKMLGPGEWLDIGCHTGWTAWHIATAFPINGDPPCQPCNYVHCLDPLFRASGEVADRFRENSPPHPNRPGEKLNPGTLLPYTSAEAFAEVLKSQQFDGIVIDGDHSPPIPYNDAVGAMEHLKDRGVILFHDAIGWPVRDGFRYLLSQGFKGRIYWTPHVVACAWRGDFTPPDHVADPSINWASIKAQMKDMEGL